MWQDVSEHINHVLKLKLLYLLLEWLLLYVQKNVSSVIRSFHSALLVYTLYLTVPCLVRGPFTLNKHWSVGSGIVHLVFHIHTTITLTHGQKDSKTDSEDIVIVWLIWSTFILFLHIRYPSAFNYGESSSSSRSLLREDTFETKTRVVKEKFCKMYKVTKSIF